MQNWKMTQILFSTIALSISLFAVAPAARASEDPAEQPMMEERADDYLPRSKFVLKSAKLINLTRHFVRLPIHQGTYKGKTYWFILTDVSNEQLATKLGLNYAPKLANVQRGCPACAQVLSIPEDITKAGVVRFMGAPDFSPRRMLKPSSTGFPLLAARPGSTALPGYSPYVRVKGTDIVYNASIIAEGMGPFDVKTHVNTHDRVLRVNLQQKWADFLMIRAFSGGKEVIYLGLESSSEEAAVLERSTFTPALANLSFPNGSFRPDGARAGLFSFANGQTGRSSPPAQGLNHLVIDGRAQDDASLDNLALLTALRNGGDARNVTEVFPTMTDPKFRLEYSPAWDLHLAFWDKDAVAARRNVAQTDAFEIRALAEQNVVTSPGGFKLAAAGVEINCPVIAFVNDPPLAPQTLAPIELPLPHNPKGNP